MTTATRAQRLRSIRELNDRWVALNLADASTAFDPAGRPDGSDYNLHHVELDADGQAQDAFAAAAARLLRIAQDEPSAQRARAPHFDTAKHPHYAKGVAEGKGGQFRPIAAQIGDALKAWLSGGGHDPDPLKGFKQPQLRKAAEQLGLNPPKGMRLAPLKSLLVAHARGGKVDVPEAPAVAKKAAPATTKPDPARIAAELKSAPSIDEADRIMAGLGRGKAQHQAVADALGIEYRPADSIATLKQAILRQAVTRRLEHDAYLKHANPVSATPGDVTSPRPAAKKAAKAVPAASEGKVDVPSLVKSLRETISSREEGHQSLEGLDRAGLLAVAREINLPGASRLSKDTLRREIVEGTVGRRLDSIATREFVGDRPGPGAPKPAAKNWLGMPEGSSAHDYPGSMGPSPILRPHEAAAQLKAAKKAAAPAVPAPKPVKLDRAQVKADFAEAIARPMPSDRERFQSELMSLTIADLKEINGDSYLPPGTKQEKVYHVIEHKIGYRLNSEAIRHGAVDSPRPDQSPDHRAWLKRRIDLWTRMGEADARGDRDAYDRLRTELIATSTSVAREPGAAKVSAEPARPQVTPPGITTSPAAITAKFTPRQQQIDTDGLDALTDHQLSSLAREWEIRGAPASGLDSQNLTPARRKSLITALRREGAKSPHLREAQPNDAPEAANTGGAPTPTRSLPRSGRQWDWQTIQADNMFMHGDSASMNLAQALHRAGREDDAQYVADMRYRISSNRSEHAPDDLETMVADLKAMMDREPDAGLRAKYQRALEDIDAPAKPLPDLPDSTPPVLRRMVEELNMIPNARRTGHFAGATKEVSLVDRLAAIIRKVDAGNGGSTGQVDTELHDVLHSLHESVDGAMQMWRLDDLLKDPEIRTWVRSHYPKA